MTKRRNDHSRSTDSSTPIRNSRNHDAELGEGLHPLAMLDGEVAQPRMGLDPLPEPIGADGDTEQEEAEHRADARAMKQRNDEPGADQKDQDVLQPGLAAQVASSCRPL